MSPLVKKEIRLLLPSWIGAMLLAIVPAWITGMIWYLNSSINVNRAELGFWLEGFIPIIFTLGILLLSLSPFGQEFSQGTFTVLLSQPVERVRIWRTKIFLLFFAFLTVWLAGIISNWCQYYLYEYLHPPYPGRLPGINHYLFLGSHFQGFTEGFSRTIVFFTLSVLVVFSGGLWTTLLLRQITNAFWFTLLTPLAIIFGTMSLLSDRLASDESVSIFIIVALAVYSIVGFLAAAILFRRCQDLQGGGGEVSFSGLKKIAGLGTASNTRAIPFRPRHRLSALSWKEIQLHQVNILIAALLLLLHLSSFVVRKIHPHFINPDVETVLETIWILWLLMPTLIGASAIAEERRFGIMESQLSLPVSRRVQLLIKFSIGLLLSLLLGAAIPLLIEGTKDLNYSLFLIAAGLFCVSFYASSFARTVLQAMGLAIVVGVVLFFGEAIAVINAFFNLLLHHYFGYYSGNGLDLLKTFLGLPILLVVLIRLIFWNYQQLRQNTSLLKVNFFSLLAAFAAIYLLSFGIYFRAWEYVTPTLPLRGFMRLSPAAEVKLAGSPGAIYAVLPDRRLWAHTHNYFFLSRRLGSWDPAALGISVKGPAAFVPGKNWVEANSDNFQAIGIQSDGSLWNIQRQWDLSHNRIEQKGPFILSQIGSDTNWSQAAGGSIGFLLLKNDGSLWTWGTNGFDQWPNKLKSDLSQLPTRLGNKTNWVRLCSSDVSAYAMNSDYDVWGWLAWAGTNDLSRFSREYSANGDWATITVNRKGHAFPFTTQLAGASSPNAPWSSFTPDWNDPFVRITTNGELWITPHFMTTADDMEWTSGRFFPLSRGKWKSAMFGWDHLIAIRSDGTLWKWPPFANAPPEYLLALHPVQLGTHSDWIALSPGGLALAADGSLWAWDQPSWHLWMAPSRKPAYMGNIFETIPASP